MKFVEHMLIAVIWVAVIAAGCWFGGPLIYHHFLGAEQAVQTVKAEQGARTAETTSANAQQAACAAQISSAVRAGAAIAKASKVQPVVAGQARPMVTSADIAAMMQ